jgi:hypothetical protein
VSRDLVLDDVLDLRAYERVRDGYRREVMALKRRRRVPLGPIMTVVFECFDTVRFQVHEMARAERIATDEGIQQELDVYNRLLPTPGALSATLFIELTSEAALREWLPALVGVERALAIEVDEPPERVAGSVPEESHALALTRDAVTPAVHYLRFPFTRAAAEAFAAAPAAALAVHHGAYEAVTLLSEETRAELVGDLAGGAPPLPLG